MANTRKTASEGHTSTEVARLMYVGPNVPGGRLLNGQVFKGGRPPWMDDLFAAIPELEQLFIPVGQVMEIQKKMKDVGSNEARLFSIAKQKLGVK